MACQMGKIPHAPFCTAKQCFVSAEPCFAIVNQGLHCKPCFSIKNSFLHVMFAKQCFATVYLGLAEEKSNTLVCECKTMFFCECKTLCVVIVSFFRISGSLDGGRVAISLVEFRKQPMTLKTAKHCFACKQCFFAGNHGLQTEKLWFACKPFLWMKNTVLQAQNSV